MQLGERAENIILKCIINGREKEMKIKTLKLSVETFRCECQFRGTFFT
jgi:hypothetical protein